MSRRQERLNYLLRQEISALLRREVKDPRLAGLVSVTEVTVSPDLKQARVFVSVLGDEEEKQQVLTGLRGAVGFFRRELADRINLRYIPEITFHYDNSLARGDHLLQLMRELDTGEPPTPGQ